MTVSLYSASVPVFVRMLKQLSHLLQVGEANAAQRKIKPEVLVNARLAPDMNPLSFQIQSATDRTKFFVARVAGQTPPSWPDEEKTFAELQARITKAIDYLGTFKPADIDGRDDQKVTLRKSGADVQISAADYLFNNAYPNFFFHSSEPAHKRKADPPWCVAMTVKRTVAQMGEGRSLERAVASCPLLKRAELESRRLTIG
jgi:uncharacterized protein